MSMTHYKARFDKAATSPRALTDKLFDHPMAARIGHIIHDILLSGSRSETTDSEGVKTVWFHDQDAAWVAISEDGTIELGEPAA